MGENETPIPPGRLLVVRLTGSLNTPIDCIVIDICPDDACAICNSFGEAEIEKSFTGAFIFKATLVWWLAPPPTADTRIV